LVPKPQDPASNAVARERAKFYGPFPDAPADGRPEHYNAETLLDGRVVENAQGTYFLSERVYESHRRHGSVEVGDLAAMPAELLRGISRGEIEPADPRRWAFLDTETTGLAGGTGTCAFLVGVGSIEDDGFHVRLFFMRDYDEEAAMLAGLAEFLSRFEVLVTYNGKAYDAPLLETRYRLKRARCPIERMAHLDLLHGARQLWKLRMESCRRMELEYRILGVEREGDLPSDLIPYYYFEYLRTRQAFRLVPMFHHNVMDIVSLACLSAVVLPAFASPIEAPLRHGADLLGLARWLRRNREHEPAAQLYRRAIDAGLPDEKLFQSLWESALLDKKLDRREQAVATLCDLAQSPNPCRRQALEELAKHYEHHEKNPALALEMTEAALALEESPELQKRKKRLQSRLSQHPPMKLKVLF
jgi:uncharacterized protein YprB with RNaseH-like and TPR domain